MKVLSLFDGISVGRAALESAGVSVSAYYSCEVDEHAMQVSSSNFPDNINLGDVNNWELWDVVFDWAEIDLILAGSPCQGFSFAGKQLGFEDPRSRLFFTFVDILERAKKSNPDVIFVLENTRMDKRCKDTISEMVGVSPMLINSALVSAQNRQRYYWTNIEGIQPPEDKNIKLCDILEELPDHPEGVSVRDKSNCVRVGGKGSPFGSKHIWDSPFKKDDSSKSTVPGPYTSRRFSILECEKLQTLPEGFTSGVSSSQRFKMVANAWTKDVFVHIFKHL